MTSPAHLCSYLQMSALVCSLVSKFNNSAREGSQSSFSDFDPDDRPIPISEYREFSVMHVSVYMV